MDRELLKVLAQYAGLGGVAVGAFILVCRSILARNILPKLSRPEAYRLLRLIVIGVWSISMLGLGLSFLPPTAKPAGAAGQEVSPHPTEARREDPQPASAGPAASQRAEGAGSAPSARGRQSRGGLVADRSADTTIIQSTHGDDSPAVAGVQGDVTIMGTETQ